MRFKCSLLGVLVFLLFATGVSANESTGGFNVEPVFPTNQDDVTGSYISVTSGTSEDFNQDFNFTISNTTDNPIIVEIEAVNALTSPNGIIQYLPSEETENSKLIDEDYSFTDYIEVQDKVELEPNTQKVVTSTVTVPKADGTILGGLSFRTITEEELEGNDEDVQFSIENRASKVVGVQVNFPTEDESNFIVDEPYVDNMPAYLAIRLPITSDTSLLEKEVGLSYIVSKGDEELFNSERGIETLDFAPQSKANFALPWDYDEIEKNVTYTIKGELEKDSTVVPFEYDFEYKDENESSLNVDRVIPNIVDGFPWWIVAIVALVLLALLLWYLLRPKYGYYSVEDESLEFINKSDEEFEWVKPVKELDNSDNKPFLMVYKKVKVKKEVVGYKFVKMVKAKQTKGENKTEDSSKEDAS